MPLASAAPSVLGLAVWSSAFTSVAIATGFERRYGVLERLAATPLGRGGLLLGKALAVGLVLLGQLVVLVVVALLLGWRPAYTVGVAARQRRARRARGGDVRRARAAAGRPAARRGHARRRQPRLRRAAGRRRPGHRRVAATPRVVRPVVEALPTAALGEGLRAGATGLVLGWPFAVLAVWLVVAGLLARRAFRWTA